MDGEDLNLTGSASEFLAMTNDERPTPSPDTDRASASVVPEPDESLSAAAETESADEDDDLDLSPEERVAAALGEGLDDDEEPRLEAEDDEDELEAAAEPSDVDLDTLTEEQKAELLAEALRARQEAPQLEVARIHAEADEAVAVAVQQTQQHIDAEFQRQVLAVSEAHYGTLIDQKIASLWQHAKQQTQMAPEDYMERSSGWLASEVKTIQRAQRVWEAEQRADWMPQATRLIEQEAVKARKQHPGVRQLYARWLAEDRKLPAKAIDTILSEADTDRMHTVADHLAELRDVKIAERRRGNQQVRETAASTFTKNRIQQPATGKPKPGKVVPIRGTPDEFLAARKLGGI